MADIPKIRFKGFTEPWEQRKLGEICSRVQGNDGRMELPTLTISAANGWMKQEDRFSGNIAGKEQKNYTLLHKGELSYNHGNSKLAKYGTVFSLQTYEEALVPRVYHSFKVEIGSADFIEYYFATKMPDRELRKLISSGARMDGLLNIGYDDFMGIKMMFPSVLEQDKIAEYFRAFDHLITLHQRKCDDTKELKKYMLQKMFPKNGEKFPEIRFKGFTEAWEQRKVSELCSISTGKSNTQDKVEDGMYPFYVRSPIVERSTKYLYDEEAVITVGDGVGTGKVFHYVNGKYDLHQRCYRMYDFTNELNAHYFYHTFSKLFYKRVMAMTAKTSVDSVRLEMISDMKIPCPNIKEQEKIGAYFNNLDNLITLHQRKCDTLKELKKYMLQNMFPKKG